MKYIKDINIGDTIKALKYGKAVEGVVLSKLPGAIIVENCKNEEKEVVDVDRITEIIKKEHEKK